MKRVKSGRLNLRAIASWSGTLGAIAIPLSLDVLCPPLQAQVPPITQEPGTNTNVVTDAGNPNQFNITDGQLSGDNQNLFHSFQRFGLNQNQIANFLANPNIQNILGRVMGGTPSEINGLIQVTVQGGSGTPNLYLMNPAGIIFGQNASLNVPASFTATTATSIGFGNNWFNASGVNDYTSLVGSPDTFAFNVNQPGAIINAANLSVSGGDLTLLGGTVVSTGQVSAPEKQITVMAVPGTNLVRLTVPNSLLSLEVQPIAAANTQPGNWAFPVQSLPQLLTGGGGGNATGLTVNSDGQVVLTGSGMQVDSNTGSVTVSGVLNAANTASGNTGGAVQVLGNKVALVEQAQVDVSGNAGGGTVLIGGDYQGKGNVPNATQTFVGRNASINADAISTGNGGKVILWADEATRFYGNISARGGNLVGNGGFVEVSGKQNLAFDGFVDVGAFAGNGGQLLLDPARVVIGTDSTNDNQLNDGQILETDPGDVFFISATRVRDILNTANVTIAASQDITVNSDIDASGNTNSFDLGLTAPVINLNASIISNGGNITFNGPVLLGSSETISTGVGAGNITFNSTLNAVNGAQELTLTAGTGNITFGGAVGNSLTLPGNTSLTFRIQDINPGTSDSMSSYSSFTAMNGELYFSANDGIHGFELWKSNGTANGTTLVSDINPGSGSSFPSDFAPLNGTLYFGANNGSVGTELWKSDGTVNGTVLIQDINPGSGSSFPSDFASLNGLLYFRADNGSVGTELWKSDGTANGTALVQDINPGPNSSSPSNLTPFNGLLYFSADNGSVGTELWQSDGTANGTTLVQDINPGSSSSFPFNLTPMAGTLYFSADNGSVGKELWKSDGTANGTVLVQDINPGLDSSYLSNFTPMDGTLYFSADNGSVGTELWQSDGTANGTVLVQDINPGPGSSSPSNLTPVNGTLYFSADNGSVGRELWQSDGTENGTQLVLDINPGEGSAFRSYDHPDFVSIGNTLYFSADNGSLGEELWKSDGTTNGTQLVRDINHVARSSNPSNFITLSGVLYFIANDSIGGTELWQSDGVPTPVNLGGSLSVTSTSATNLTANSTIVGNRINLTAGNITLNGNLFTSGTVGNSVTLSATAGNITTRNIVTSVSTGDGGPVTLSATGNITTESINTQTQTSDDPFERQGGAVTISTSGNVAVKDVVTTVGNVDIVGASITTGKIDNSYYGGYGIDGGDVTLNSTLGDIVVYSIKAQDDIDITAAGLFRAIGTFNYGFSFTAPAEPELQIAAKDSPELINFFVSQGFNREEVENSQLEVSIIPSNKTSPISIAALSNTGSRIIIRHSGATNTDNGDIIQIYGGSSTEFVLGPLDTPVAGQEFTYFLFSDPLDSNQPFPQTGSIYLQRNIASSVGLDQVPGAFPTNISGTAGGIVVGGGTDATLNYSLRNRPFVPTIPPVDPVGGGTPDTVVSTPVGGSTPDTVVSTPVGTVAGGGTLGDGGSSVDNSGSGSGGTQIATQIFEQQEEKEVEITRLCRKLEQTSEKPTNERERSDEEEEECEKLLKLLQQEDSAPTSQGLEFQLPTDTQKQPDSSNPTTSSLPDVQR